MPVKAWAIARKRGNATEYYADELPGTDKVRWIDDPSQCCAYEHEGWAETIREALMKQGYTDIFVTTVDLI